MTANSAVINARGGKSGRCAVKAAGLASGGPRRPGVTRHLAANSAGSAHYLRGTSHSPALSASPPNACLTRLGLAALANPGTD